MYILLFMYLNIHARIHIRIHAHDELSHLVKFFNTLIPHVYFTILCVNISIIITINIAEVDLVIGHIAFVIHVHVQSVC